MDTRPGIIHSNSIDQAGIVVDDAEMTEQKTTKKRTLISHKDVQLVALTRGAAGLDAMCEEGQCSRATVRHALQELDDKGHLTAEISAWSLQRFGHIGRGRTSPKSGETRSYRAQQIKDGGPFLRLPLDSLGVIKGQAVLVRFDGGAIHVTGAAETTSH